jgi:hypothetical protein
MRDQFLPENIDGINSTEGKKARHENEQKDTEHQEGQLFHDRQLYAAQALRGSLAILRATPPHRKPTAGVSLSSRYLHVLAEQATHPIVHNK